MDCINEDNKRHCNKCVDGYFLKEINGIKICEKCSEGCKTCIDENNCEQCMTGYELINITKAETNQSIVGTDKNIT